jgi:hypothetical protein
MKRGNPGGYERLEDMALPIQRLWLASQPSISGPLRLEVELPGRTTDWQTLLAAGRRYRHDVLCIRRLAGDLFQLRFHHRGFPVVRSQALPVPAAGRCTVDVALGSLYPVNARVLERLYPERQAAGDARRVAVSVDGSEVLRAEFDFVASPPRLVSPGHDLIQDGECDEPFAGRILSAERTSPSRDQAKRAAAF